MGNQEFADEMNIPLEMALRFKPEARAAYERLIDVGRALNRGEMPEGVIVTRDRGKRARY